MFLIVFDEHVRRGKTGGGNAREMDFESFLDFVLALENKDTPEGLTYLFRCLDLQGRGHLTTADIHSLFRFAPIFFLDTFVSNFFSFASAATSKFRKTSFIILSQLRKVEAAMEVKKGSI